MKALITCTISINSREVKIDGKPFPLPGSTAGQSILKTIYKSQGISYPKFFKMDVLSRLGFIASELLLNRSGLTQRHEPDQCGIFLMNASSSLDSDEKYQETISDPDQYFPSPSIFVYTLPNIMIGEIAIRHGLKGENAVFISGEPDLKLLHAVVTEAFRQNRITAALTGWVEAWHDQLRAFLMLVESEPMVKSSPENGENIIFDAQKIEDLFKLA